VKSGERQGQLGGSDDTQEVTQHITEDKRQDDPKRPKTDARRRQTTELAKMREAGE